MRKPDRTLEPQQARSRESLSRLLKAAVQVLGHHGVAGATIPRIAGLAGLTPGAVYRRFDNKDELLETAILRILEDQDKHFRSSLPVETAAEIPLPALAEQLIASLLLSYRRNAAFLRAVRQFQQGKEGSAFWKKSMKLQMRFFEYLVAVLVASGNEIKHENPRAAIALGLLMVIGTLWEVVVLPGDGKLWKELLPKDDHVLGRELTRSFLAYAGVERRAR
ncbi:MAG TPA: TetR/AcrR family transcriptional regulator [Steroidobacteraceae bacterium]|jgi:AcrR family transcriptional regulator|nr:TetR/AcrR family transcriptional regulator [Steroidobacteraceae bacterium]